MSTSARERCVRGALGRTKRAKGLRGGCDQSPFPPFAPLTPPPPSRPPAPPQELFKRDGSSRMLLHG
jgi:hypothetical protein